MGEIKRKGHSCSMNWRFVMICEKTYKNKEMRKCTCLHAH